MFCIEWGSYTYNMMPFKLNNSPAMFSKDVVVAFKEYIHKFVEVHLDDWIAYNFLKDHVVKVKLMLSRCWKM